MPIYSILVNIAKLVFTLKPYKIRNTNYENVRHMPKELVTFIAFSKKEFEYFLTQLLALYAKNETFY